ncbi:MAG: MaoC family dehydratase [Alphaproteobacteria bacterium]|nr:MaoC family dehydratase [Alphaproteobacteria bacterium]MDP1670510.1 MaoC family dehydratase [Alphaproteobacteria bacterium]
MLSVAYGDLSGLAGKEIGVSEWVTLDQAKVNQFADATGDHQWIHVDVARAKREMATGGTIVHGYFTLSLIPKFMFELLEITGISQMINYGANKVRFTNMVPTGSRVRGRLKVMSVELKGKGATMNYEMVLEIEGQERPACIAEVIMMALP